MITGGNFGPVHIQMGQFGDLTNMYQAALLHHAVVIITYINRFHENQQNLLLHLYFLYVHLYVEIFRDDIVSPGIYKMFLTMQLL